MQEVEACNRLVGHLGIDAHHFGVIERLDEAEHRADRRQIDVAARLVGLRLQRELQVIALVDRVLAEEVDCLAEALQASSGLRTASVSTPSRPPQKT